jgi:peptide deformylase
MTIINPIIIGRTKEKDKKMEGCLSAPGVSVLMKRHLGVDVECQNLQGEKIQYRFTNYDARVLQHEWDHLNGRCIAHKLANYAKI